MSYRLRPMRWWDIDAILPIEAELFAGDPPWTAELFWSELAGVPGTRWYVVAEHDAEIAGYAGLMLTPGVLAVGAAVDSADIQTLAVAPAHQGRGLGTTLLSALLGEAAGRGAREVLLEVRADNAPALALYGRHGFERLSRRRGYYDGGRVDGWVLRRRGGP